MRKIVKTGGRRVTLNTDTARFLGATTHGEYGDPAGYELRHFVTPTGIRFMLGIGGADSPYPKPALELEQ